MNILKRWLGKSTVGTAVPAKPKTARRNQEGVRDTVEAVAIAFVLAFVFKTFEAEAFVIPTGSMAPTLYGRHKEIQCTGCQLTYTVGASQELNQDTGALTSYRVTQSECPNCRYLNRKLEHAPVFNGDRIVVNKQVSAYRRYDVVVFKNPEEPHINYIKRLIGLPGETVRIRQGDIYSRRSESDPWQIQRKEDLKKQREIQLLVYDDSQPPTALLTAGAEERWAPCRFDPADTTMGGWPSSANAWKADTTARSYALDESQGETSWIRYRHLVPGYEHWSAADSGAKIERPLQPQLIADFCGFNSDGNSGDDHELYWTNDLTVEFELEVLEVRDQAEILVELEEGMRSVQCRINPGSGVVSFWSTARDGSAPQLVAEGTSGLQGPGSYNIAFANVDDRLTLWVDHTPVQIEQKSELSTPDLNLPTDRDLAPAGIAGKAIHMNVSGLLLRRDIYYRNDLVISEEANSITPNPASSDYRFEYSALLVTEVDGRVYRDLVTNLHTPERYAEVYERAIREQEAAYGKLLEYPLANDEYLMFGDNSPASKDSRLFDYYSRPQRGIHSNRYAVRQEDLIGEALCIFWPHGVPFMNGGRGFTIMSHRGDKDYPLYTFPFYPNISRMKSIR